MSKKLLRCKDFACQMTHGLIAIIDDEAVVVNNVAVLSETTCVVVYMPATNVHKIVHKYMSNNELLTTYIVTDEL